MPDPTLGTGNSIGKYFSIVSVVPSVLLAFWIYALFASLGPSGGPSLDTLWANAFEPRFLALALAVALAVAVVGHPLQFAMVQTLEGYWGLSRLGLWMRIHLVKRHVRRLAMATIRKERAQEEYERLCGEANGTPVTYLTGITDNDPPELESPDAAKKLIRLRVLMEEAAWVEAQYPDHAENVLPTRLGNQLRRHELRAGRAVRLPISDWATHIGMVAKSEHSAYVNDQRTAMDLAVRMAWSMGAAALVTFTALWSAGWAALLTLVPFTAAYLSYGGAVVAAGSYGVALQAWVDLNRFRLYDELHLVHPAHSKDEREANASLGDLCEASVSFDMSYTEPQTEH